jgi:hypothetical protein
MHGPTGRTLNTKISFFHNNTASSVVAVTGPALAALEFLRLRKSFKYTRSVEKFDVSRSTLSKMHRDVQRDHDEIGVNCRKLNTIQEKEPIKSTNRLCKQGLPSKIIVRDLMLEMTYESIVKN